MIDCTSAVKRLWDFIELQLDAPQRAEMDEHLAFCRRCCGEVEFAEELRGLLKDSARPNLPPDAADRLNGFIETIEEGG